MPVVDNLLGKPMPGLAPQPGPLSPVAGADAAQPGQLPGQPAGNRIISDLLAQRGRSAALPQ